MAVYDCYEGERYICTGTPQEIADAIGLKLNTVRSYISGPGGHRYQMYRYPRRQRDLEDMRFYRISECRGEDGELLELQDGG